MTNVLIIDDSSTVRFYYREVLEGAGFTVEEALNGIEALEKAAAQAFDLAIVDVNMPKMDGYTFLKQIRRHPELRSLPAMMISTEAGEADRVKAHAAGANIYIVKPVDPAAFVTHAKLMTGQPSTAARPL
jgi:two-component system chemotaxis response regulator CheY